MAFFFFVLIRPLVIRQCRHALAVVKCTNVNEFACSLISESTVRQRRVHMAAAVVSRYESPSGVNMREGCMAGTLSTKTKKSSFFTLALGKYFSVFSVERSGSSIAPSDLLCVLARRLQSASLIWRHAYHFAKHAALFEGIS